MTKDEIGWELYRMIKNFKSRMVVARSFSELTQGGQLFGLQVSFKWLVAIKNKINPLDVSHYQDWSNQNV